jgi:hypothetical protein
MWKVLNRYAQISGLTYVILLKWWKLQCRIVFILVLCGIRMQSFSIGETHFNINFKVYYVSYSKQSIRIIKFSEYVVCSRNRQNSFLVNRREAFLSLDEMWFDFGNTWNVILSVWSWPLLLNVHLRVCVSRSLKVKYWYSLSCRSLALCLKIDNGSVALGPSYS